ncbi:hypothetical protein EHS25_008633 [Saitozyma podzolica]|uniref:Uncharacterized protein n=1 Tax=Saitozyma podzolica TaxID=1890683 RepID=A0A427YM66_9TREE|nr:hypothetical protein EHS25_008633 [Saitozyma podzolica]
MPYLVHAQSSTSVPAAASTVVPSATSAAASSPSSSAPASSTVYTGTPTLTFASIPTLTACGSVRIDWALSNEDPTKYNVALSAINQNVNQAIPSAVSSAASSALGSSATASTSASGSASSAAAASSAASTAASAAASTSASAAASARALLGDATARHLLGRTSLNINETIATTPANVGYTWSPISLPEGRYVLIGRVDDGHDTWAQSGVFTVLESNDTSCLAAFAASSSVAGASSTKNPSATGSLASANNASSSPNSWSTGAIVGCVIGIIAGLIILGLIAWCLLRRRRRGDTAGHDHREMSEAGRNSRRASFADRLTNMAPRGRGVRVPSESTSPPMSYDDHSHSGHGHYGPQVVSNPIALASIHSFRPDSIGSMPRHSGESGKIHRTLSNFGSAGVPAAAIASAGGAEHRGGEELRRGDSTPGTSRTGTTTASDPFATNPNTPLQDSDADAVYSGLAPISSQQSSATTRSSATAGTAGTASARPESTFDPDPPTARPASSVLPMLPALPGASPHFPPSSSGATVSRSRSVGNSKTSSPAGTPQLEQGERRPSGASLAGGGVARSNSQNTRRKPVPSLGPELRGEMERQRSLKGRDRKGGEVEQLRRQSYQLMPDPPAQQH